MSEYDVPGWMVECWRFYGLPGARGGNGMRTKDGKKVQDAAIGEVRYAIGWHAQQVGRIDWRVLLDGQPPTPPSENQDGEIADTAESDGSHELISKITGPRPDVWVRNLATNLLVAGKCWPAAPPAEVDSETGQQVDSTKPWRIVSVVRKNRDEILKASPIKVEALWQHPADEEEADPPLFGVLDVLYEIDQLQRLSRAQNRSRSAQRPIVAVSNQMSAGGVGANSGSIHDDLAAVLGAEMDDETTSAAPAIVSGPSEVIKEGWADALMLDSPYDARIDGRLRFAIERLSWGLPNPPEILTGYQNRAMAVAFQITRAAYREHVEPTAEMIADILASILQLIIAPDANGRVPTVSVVPDPTKLLAQEHTPEQALEAWDRGLVSSTWTRSKLNIPGDEVATPEDLALLNAAKGAPVVPGVQTPADEPVAAAAGSGAPGDLERLAAALADLDTALSESLAGAAAMAIERARERVGARARALLKNDAVASARIDGVANAQVGASLGRQALDSAGVDLENTVRDSLTTLADWWETERLSDARDSLAALLGPVPGPWAMWAAQSAETLLDGLTTFVVDRIDLPGIGIVPAALLRQVVSLAGGQDGSAVVASAQAVPVETPAVPGGFATGPAVVRELRTKGIVVTGWRWKYGSRHRDNPHPIHKALGGSFVSEFPVDGIFYPSDHKGCLCSAVPVLRDVKGRFTADQSSADEAA